MRNARHDEHFLPAWTAVAMWRRKRALFSAAASHCAAASWTRALRVRRRMEPNHFIGLRLPAFANGMAEGKHAKHMLQQCWERRHQSRERLLQFEHRATHDGDAEIEEQQRRLLRHGIPKRCMVSPLKAHITLAALRIVEYGASRTACTVILHRC